MVNRATRCTACSDVSRDWGRMAGMALKRPLKRPQWNVRVETQLQDVIQDQADRVGLKFATYVELLLAQIHGYDGPYLPEVAAELPTAMPMKRIRELVAAITRDDCVDVGHDNALKPIKLAEPLRDLMGERCRHDLDVNYSAYVRAVLRIAAGIHVQGRGVQSSLDDITLPRGGGQLRRAS